MGGGGGPGVGRSSASHLTERQPDKNHHAMRLYASYRAENWSIHMKTISCNVWNQRKPFKIASNMSFDRKNNPKSSKISKNQFLQYLSTRNFMENSNPRTPGLIYIEKPSKIIKKRCQNGGLRGHYILPFKGPL